MEKRDRILLISALAVLLLTLFGATGEHLGMDRYLKVNTVKHRTMSLFRQGCYYYRQMAQMTCKELKDFFDNFLNLLNEKEKLQDILWVI